MKKDAHGNVMLFTAVQAVTNVHLVEKIEKLKLYWYAFGTERTISGY